MLLECRFSFHSILKASCYIIVYVNDNIKIYNDGVKLKYEVSQVVKIDENIKLDDLKRRSEKIIINS